MSGGIGFDDVRGWNPEYAWVPHIVQPSGKLLQDCNVFIGDVPQKYNTFFIIRSLCCTFLCIAMFGSDNANCDTTNFVFHALGVAIIRYYAFPLFANYLKYVFQREFVAEVSTLPIYCLNSD